MPGWVSLANSGHCFDFVRHWHIPTKNACKNWCFPLPPSKIPNVAICFCNLCDILHHLEFFLIDLLFFTEEFLCHSAHPLMFLHCHEMSAVIHCYNPFVEFYPTMKRRNQYFNSEQGADDAVTCLEKLSSLSFEANIEKLGEREKFIFFRFQSLSECCRGDSWDAYGYDVSYQSSTYIIYHVCLAHGFIWQFWMSYTQRLRGMMTICWLMIKMSLEILMMSITRMNKKQLKMTLMA